jgi:type II secretory pathway component GspD/PulD (secretin)
MNEQTRRINRIVMLAMVACFARAFAQDVLPVAPSSDADVAQTATVSEAVPMPVITPSSEVMVEPLGEPAVSAVPAEVSTSTVETPAVEAEPAAMESVTTPADSAQQAPAATSGPEAIESPAAEVAAPELVMPAPEVTEAAAPSPEVVSPVETQAAVSETSPIPVEAPAGEAQVAPAAESVPSLESTATPLTEPAVITTPLTESEVAAAPAPESQAVVPEVGSIAETSTVGTLVNPAPAEAPPAPVAAEPAPETNVTTELIELQPEGGEGGADMVGAGAKENLISISLDNVPLQDVMRMFARISGANIVSGTNLQGNITVNLKDVEWQPALRTILDTAGMTLVMKSPGIYSIVSKSEAASAPVTIDTIYLKFTTVTNVLPVIQKMLISSNASIASFAAANALVIQETSERLDIIKEVVSHIDKPRPQVFIEAKFVELNDQAIKDLGVNWQSLENYTLSAKALSWSVTENRDWLKSNDKKLAQTDNRSHFDGVSDSFGVDGRQSLTAVGPPIDGTPGRSVEDTISQTRDVSMDIRDSYAKTVKDVRAAVMSADDFQVTLSALKQQSGVSVVSNPRIVVASGETALIHVGRKDPNYVTKEEAGPGNTVTTKRELSGDLPFVKTGVEVDVRPVVNTESNITIRITPKLSRILPRGAGQLDGDLSPISERQINSEFNLESGRTVAIGGLTTTDDRENVTKIPLLGDIPIIGKYLFSHTHTEKLQDEVIIFVTVGMASPETITVSAGIPSEGKLIHRHLAQQAAGAEAAAKAGK